MNRSLKNICGRKYGGDKDEEIGKFFSSCKILTHYFSANYIFLSCKKLFDFSREVSGKVYFSVILYYTFAAESDA